MTNTTSSTTAAAGADFTQLSAHALELADKLGVEIVGCANGFNAFSEGEIMSADCTAVEIERWLEGYGRAKFDDPNESTGHNVTRFTDVEFQRIMDHILYRNWSLVADHTGVKIIGPHFNTHFTSYEQFEAFIYGYNAAGAALRMLSTGYVPDHDADGAE